MRAYITSEQAIELLPSGENIHTFINGEFGLIGADWGRTELEDKLKRSECLELAGEMAKGLGHGLVAYDKSAGFQSDLLFIETDSKKLEALEEELKQASEAV